MQAKIGEIELSYTDEGKGAPVVLLHGHPFDRSMWQAQVEALKENYRVICPDLRGYGETSAVGEASKMSEMATDVAALLDYLKLEKVVLGGLSMGGYVALEFFHMFPEKVRALILADTKAAADTEEARRTRFETAEKVLREGMTPLADEMISKVIAPATFENKPETVARVRQMMLAANPAGTAAGLRGMAERRDHTELLKRIDAPTLIIVGEADSITPPSEAEKMHEAIKNSGLVKISAAGHLSPVENPDEVNKALQDFLKIS